MDDSLTMKQYMDCAQRTAKYPGKGDGTMSYAVRGAAGAVGKLAKASQRIERGMAITDLKKVLGDLLWYTFDAIKEAGLDVDDVARTNIEMLTVKEFSPLDD